MLLMKMARSVAVTSRENFELMIMSAKNFSLTKIARLAWKRAT
jgi:hypothetical protein